MPVQDVRLSDDNTAQFINRLDLGLDVSDDPDDIEASSAADLLNVRFLQGRMRSDTGFREFQNTVLGAPRLAYRFQLANQSVQYLLITNEHVYRRTAGEWQYVSDGTATQTDAVEPAGETVISVVSAVGFVATDRIGITLDDGSQHRTTVQSVDGGLNDITIVDAIPIGRQVNNGASVIKAVRLTGSDDRQISIVTDPSNDFVLFTNGVNPVKKYDPVGGGSVTNLGGLSAVSVDTCRTLEIFNNSLWLGFTTEGGTNKPQRVRNSQVGNYELWTGGVAGIEDFYDEEDEIVRLERLGPFLIAYRRRSIRRGEWTEDPDDIVHFETTVSDKGVVSHDAVIVVGNLHVCVDSTDIYEYRGGFDVRPISGNLFHRLFGIDSVIRPERFNRLFGFQVKGLRELFILWSDTTDEYPTNIARLSLPTGAWSLREFPIEMSGWGIFDGTASRSWLDVPGSWDQQGVTWTGSVLQKASPSILLGSPSPTRIFEYDFINPTDSGTTIPWRWISKNFLNPKIELRLDSFALQGTGGLLTVEYSPDKGNSWFLYGTVQMSGASQRYEISKQTVVTQVMWRLSGVGSNFSFAWFAFMFSPEGEKRQ